MGLLDNVTIPRRQLHILFVVGTSETMCGSKISSINGAIESVLPMISEISDMNPDAYICHNMMRFSDESRWQYAFSVPARDFIFEKIVPLGNRNNLGNCYSSLNNYLDGIQEKVSFDALFAPVIILIVDRNSTDNVFFGLKSLKNNPLFNSAIRIAIPIGDSVDKNVMKDFTGSYDTVIGVHSIDTLKNHIRIKALSKDYIAKFQKGNVKPKVTLYNAIREILTTYGKDLIAEERLINFLSDFHAFDVRATRRVMQTFLQMGYGQQVLELDIQDSPDKLLKISNISFQLSQEGFQKKHVEYVLDSVCYGLGWQGELPEEIDESEEEEESVDKHYVTVGKVSFAMVSIVGGTFDLGATPEQGLYAAFDEKPSIPVTVSSFYLADTPVTQALWTEIMGDNPSHFKGDNLPVERVSWEDCQEFIKRLNIKTGMKFRLPTEAEWEYAARGGQYSKHHKYAGANDDAKFDCMWFKENSKTQSHDVKGKSANELDLYDMSGNISEWCSDWYFNSYANNGEKVNPKGPASGVAKVYRGGSWDDKAMNCRVSKRFSMNPIFKNKLVGLRLAANNI